MQIPHQMIIVTFNVLIFPIFSDILENKKAPNIATTLMIKIIIISLLVSIPNSFFQIVPLVK